MAIASFFSNWPSWLPQLLPGLWVSLKLTGAILAVGLPLGLLLAIMIESRIRLLRGIGIAIVEFGRGTPLLVLLYLVYFGLPSHGITLTAFVSTVVAIGFNAAAYGSEIFRAGLLAIPTGQREAARAIGLMPMKELQVVVLPQAIRVVIPPLIGFTILVFQATSLAYTIGVPELLSRAYNIGTISFKVLEVFVLAALLYAVISIPMSQLVNFFERRSIVRS